MEESGDGSAPVATESPGPEAAPAPPAPSPRPRQWPARVAIGFAVLVLVVAVAGFAIHLPYTTIAPGEALSLPSRVSIDGARTYPEPRGDIRLLFVRESNHVNLWRFIQAHLEPDIDLVKDGAVNPGSLTPSQLNAQGLQAMADAKTAATAVALEFAGYKVTAAPGLTVHDLVAGMPAISVLNWGDVITSADGAKLTSAAGLTKVIDRHKVGDAIALVVQRGGKTLHLSVKIGVFADGAAKGRKGVGVELLPRLTFPMKVAVDTTNIGGPSAGLAMSLAILDDLTPGNLTGGAHVAVTGTIDFAGNVGEIGGIEQKTVAARAAHVSLFIVPQCSPSDPAPYLAACKADLARAVKRAGSKISVKPVSTFAQALQVLHDAGGAPVVRRPTASTGVAA